MKKLLLIWTFSMFLITCKKTDSPNNSTPPTIELGPNTVIIDNSTSQTVQSIDSTHILFDGNTDQLQRLVTGNIIVSSATTNAPTGFLRKITSIQKNGTVYNILTSEASLLETFKTLHIDDSSQSISFNPTPLSIILKDNDGNNNTIEDQLKIKLTYNYSPKLKVKIDIDNFQLIYSKISGNLLSSITKEITVGRNIGIVNKKIDVISHPISAIVIPGTPIVIVPVLRISVGADLSINIDLVASDTKTGSTEAYIEYKNNNWNPGFTRTMDNQFSFSGINGNVTAKVYVEPALDFKLWGSNWAKGSIITQAYLKASAQLLPTPDCELKAGISAGAEANLKFFGVTFTAASYPDIFDYSKILYTCSATNAQFPTVSTNSVTSITNNSAVSGGNVTNSGASAVSARGICWATSPHPTTSNNTTTNGGGVGGFNSSLSGLNPNTTYYVRAYATNAQGTSYGNETIFTTLPNPGTVTDIDGNVYTTVTIGTQIWLVENLKTTRYRNGDPIPNITDNSQWIGLTTGAFAYHNNDAQYNNTYGKLYNWYAANDARNIAPVGWHIPSLAEWTTLQNYLGGVLVAGGKLKEMGTTYWLPPNTGATNSSGFTGRPGGNRSIDGSFVHLRDQGTWWSSSPSNASNGTPVFLRYDTESFDAGVGNDLPKIYGLSIRCIKD